MEFVRDLGEGMWEITFGALFGSDSELFDRVLGAVMSLLIGFLLALLFFLGYIMLNEIWVEQQGSQQKAVSYRDYTPGHFQPIIISTGKTTTTVLQYIPPSYRLCFIFDDSQPCIGVSEQTYHNTKIGDVYEVTYGYGRLDGRYVLQGLSAPHSY